MDSFRSRPDNLSPSLSREQLQTVRDSHAAVHLHFSGSSQSNLQFSNESHRINTNIKGAGKLSRLPAALHAEHHQGGSGSSQWFNCINKYLSQALSVYIHKYSPIHHLKRRWDAGNGGQTLSGRRSVEFSDAFYFLIWHFPYAGCPGKREIFLNMTIEISPYPSQAQSIGFFLKNKIFTLLNSNNIFKWLERLYNLCCWNWNVVRTVVIKSLMMKASRRNVKNKQKNNNWESLIVFKNRFTKLY